MCVVVWYLHLRVDEHELYSKCFESTPHSSRVYEFKSCVIFGTSFLCCCRVFAKSLVMARPELSPSADLAVCQIEELGKSSGMLSKTQSPKVAAVCEAAKEMLLWKAKKLVADSLGLPLLSSKSCDGTPLRMKNYSSRTLLPEMKKQKTTAAGGWRSWYPMSSSGTGTPLRGGRLRSSSQSRCHSPKENLQIWWWPQLDKPGALSDLWEQPAVSLSTMSGTGPA
jgi:hypothetical protein